MRLSSLFQSDSRYDHHDARIIGEEMLYFRKDRAARNDSIRMTKSDRVTGSSSKKSDPHESEYRASAVTKCKDIISIKGEYEDIKKVGQNRRDPCERAQGTG